MSDFLIHSSDAQPVIYPILGNVDQSEMDRVQRIDKTVALNRDRIEEVGNREVVGHLKGIPAVAYRLTQYEYGSLDFYRKLANKGDAVTDINLDDFKASYFDIASFLTNDNDEFRGTLWIPELRVAGFSFTIGDPDAIIERSFDLVGEDWIVWQGNNKYFIYKKETVESGELGSGDTFEVTLDDPQPVQDPKKLDYIKRIIRVRSGTSTELVITTDYTFSAPQTLTILSAQVGDIYKIYYTASSYIGGEQPWTANTTDLPAIKADSVSIFIETSNYVYKLQDITIDVRNDREDNKEIGNSKVVQRGIRSKTVGVTLGRILDKFTIEEVLAGEVPDYGKLDVREFEDNLNVIVKVWSDNTKTTFKLGMKATGLAPTEVRAGDAVDAYVTAGDSLEGEALLITSSEGSL